MHKKITYSDIHPLSQKIKTKMNYVFYIELLRKEWKNIVGGILCEHCLPFRIQKQKLYIACENNTYQREIVQYNDNILKHTQKLVYFINNISILNEKYYWRANRNISQYPETQKISFSKEYAKKTKTKHANFMLLEKLVKELENMQNK